MMTRILNYIIGSLLLVSLSCCAYLYISKNNIIKENDQLVKSLNKELLSQQKNIEILNENVRKKEAEDYEKYQKIQKDNESLRVAVADGSRKLRIKIASCGATSAEVNATSMDNGTYSTGVIDQRDAQSIIAITEKADKYKSQLEALQNYIKEYNRNIEALKEK